MILDVWSSFNNTFVNMFEMTWPMILISVVLLSSLRFSYLIKNRNQFILYKEVLMLLFMIYILCLFQIVTFQDVSSFGTNNFIPFKEMTRYSIGSRYFIKNVLGNVIMFVPYGFFVSYYGENRKYSVTFILVFVASIVIETTQLAIGRVFDVDDIILNVVGGTIGYLIYLSLDKIGNICPKVFKSEVFLNILAIIIFSICAACIVWR